MAADRSMHQMTDSVWGAASPARSPAAARTLLASSWATGCRLLATTQICFYTEITGGGGGGSRRNTVRWRKPSFHHFSIRGWFERIPGISACNLASVWVLKYLLKRQIFKNSSSSKCLWKTLWIGRLPLYKYFTNHIIKVETNGVSSVKNWNPCVAFFFNKVKYLRVNE